MTFSSIGLTLIPLLMVLFAVAVARPNLSTRARTICGVGFVAILAYLPEFVPRLTLVLAVVLYVLYRLGDLKKSPPSTVGIDGRSISLINWGKANRNHEDSCLRDMAAQVQNAKRMSAEDQVDLIDQINKRTKDLQPTSTWIKFTSVFNASLIYIIIYLTTGAPTFSALYSVTTSHGQYVGYVVAGPMDVLLVDSKSRTARVMLPEEVLSKRLCGPNPSAPWFARTITWDPPKDSSPCENA